MLPDFAPTCQDSPPPPNSKGGIFLSLISGQPNGYRLIGLSYQLLSKSIISPAPLRRSKGYSLISVQYSISVSLSTGFFTTFCGEFSYTSPVFFLPNRYTSLKEGNPFCAIIIPLFYVSVKL